MATGSSKRYFALVCAGLVGLAGCGGDDSPAETTETTSGTDTDTVTASATDTDASATDATTDMPTGTTAPATTSTTTNDTADTDTPTSSSSGSDPDDPVEDGELCSMDEGCISGFCFSTGILGGICGECAADADCDAGCHPPNPFADPATPSACEPNGGAGTACETAAACDGGASCALIFDLAGVLDIRGCSECETTKDCLVKGEICNPTYDLQNLGGSRSCVLADTLADGEHCDPSQNPDACLNSCRSVDFEDVSTVGVCSPCAGAGDCLKLQECEPATVVDGELVPAACVDIR